MCRLLLIAAAVVVSSIAAGGATQAAVSGKAANAATWPRAQAVASNGPSPTPTRVPKGTITEFGQDGTVLALPYSWRLNFDARVEVRDHIGDYSITPRNGQFLVIWFTQISSDGTALPLGSFQLQVGDIKTNPKSFKVLKIAKEGTVALILTEWDWNPKLMDANTPYRTGIVFDIAPEDTQFRLLYSYQENGIFKHPVDIRFTA